MVLAGWALDVHLLRSILPGAVPMVANSAALLVLLGTALIVRVRRPMPRLVALICGIVLAVVVGTAAEYAFGLDLGIDRLLGSAAIGPGAPYPGRIAVSALIGFAAAVASLLALGRTWRGSHPSEGLAVACGVVGTLGLLGYAYGAEALTSIGSDTQIAFPTSIGFVILSAALVSADPSHALTSVIQDRGASGRLTRRLLGVVLVAVPMSGAVALGLGSLGLVDARGGLAIAVSLDLLLLVVIGAWIVRSSRRLEAELESSERRFRDTLSSVSLIAVMVDTEGTITYANDYLLRITGWNDAEVLGQDWYELFHTEDDQPSSRAAFRRLIETGSAQPHRVGFLRTRSGAMREIEWSNVVLRDAAGSITGIAGIGTDVTERSAAQGALHRSELRLSTALDTLLEGVSILSAVRDAAGEIVDFRIEMANPAIADLSHVGVEDQVGRSLLELFPAHRSSGLFDAYVRVVETGRPFESGPVRYVDPEAAGGPIDRYLEQRVAKLGDGCILSVQDVTARRRSEVEMRRLAAVVEQVPSSVVITDRTGSIEYVNPAFEQASGWSRDEVMGKNPRILKSGVQDPSFYHAMWSTLTSGRPFVADITNRRKDGTLYQEESVVSPIHDDAGAVTSYVAIKRDVTAQRATEAAQERQARERALIAGTIRQLAGGPSPDQTADLICRQLVSLSDITTADMGTFTSAGQLVSMAFARADGGPVELRRIPFQRSRVLRAQTEGGPWVERWVHRPWHPYERLFAELGVEAVAHVPVHLGDRLIGIVNVSAAGPAALERLTESLPALLEFAGITAAILGPAIDDMAAEGRGRERVGLILRTRGFRSVFQPIVDLATSAHVGYEALTRFSNGVAPDLVFEEARGVGLGHDLEIATLGAAIQAATRLPAGTWLSLNASPGLVANDKRLASTLRAADRPVVLEITEHEAVSDYAALRAAVDRLRPKVRVAVDDAGAGVANFSHIVELKPAFVKLDIGLIRGIDADLTRRALVIGLQQFAAASKSQTLAEGIETDAELAVLGELGVPFGQGYLLARPAPADEWSEPRTNPGA